MDDDRLGEGERVDEWALGVLAGFARRFLSMLWATRASPLPVTE